MRIVIDDQRAKQASDEASTQLIAWIKREKEEAKGSVDAFLSEVGASSLRDYISRIDGVKGTKEQLLTHDAICVQ